MDKEDLKTIGDIKRKIKELRKTGNLTAGDELFLAILEKDPDIVLSNEKLKNKDPEFINFIRHHFDD